MFNNLIFFILVMLLISLAGEIDPRAWSSSPMVAFLEGMLTFCCLIALMFFQKKALKKSIFSNSNIAAFEIIIFMMFFYLFLGAHRIFFTVPYGENLQTPYVIFSLLLALLPYSIVSAPQNLRLSLPFVLPFLLFSMFLDILSFIPYFKELTSDESSTVAGTFAVFIVGLCFMGTLMIFMPPLVVTLWRCKLMQNETLRHRLENLCQRAGFKHAGILDWNILKNVVTAAIIGIVPRFRYVMFTKRIQTELSSDSLEAVLAHEIGHNYHKHLLIYPFILLGMIVCNALFSMLFYESIYTYFSRQQALYPSHMWTILYPIALYVPYAIIILLYFRIVFGYFSRLFERQADLFGFKLGIPGQHMVQALDDVAIATGYTHLIPNWHHHSIQERMNFLNSAINDSKIIEQHNKLVKKSLFFYFILLSIGCLLLLSPFVPELFPFYQISSVITWLSHKIRNLVI